MADDPLSPLLRFESPIVTPYHTGGALTLDDESSASKLLVLADPASPTAQQLATTFGSAHRNEGVLVCGVRPNEWLILGSSEACWAAVATLDQEGHVSVVDLTHSRAMFRISGAPSASALEKLCSVDWNDDMTPNLAVVSASVAKVTCDIIRDDHDGVRSYVIACDRSFGQYLFDAVVDAAQEFRAQASLRDEIWIADDAFSTEVDAEIADLFVDDDGDEPADR